MLRPELRSFLRRLLVLCALLACLAATTADPVVKCKANRAALICCSACETDPPPLPCRRGCSPSC